MRSLLIVSAGLVLGLVVGKVVLSASSPTDADVSSAQLTQATSKTPQKQRIGRYLRLAADPRTPVFEVFSTTHQTVDDEQADYTRAIELSGASSEPWTASAPDIFYGVIGDLKSQYP